MKNILVIIREGKHIHETLASVLYDRYGSKTKQRLMVCKDWESGIQQATGTNYDSVLFLDSGTVFTDWNQWIEALAQYPHRGLVGHLVWKNDRDSYPWLHPQCWYIDIDLLNSIDWISDLMIYPSVVRSEDNIHDDYTPLYVKPGHAESCQHPVTHFSQRMIAAQISKGFPVINWNQKMRSLKHYIYADDPIQADSWNESRVEYLELAENQFWILNNEPIRVYPGRRQVSPAAGLHWIVNICDPTVSEIDVVDISSVQVRFAEYLWNNWDGQDYGQQVVDYIRTDQLKHYEIDRADIDKIERLKLRNMSYLKSYVNDRFQEITGDDFQQRWQQTRRTKSARFQVGNLVKWVLENGIDSVDSMWVSNILDYKWTLLNTTPDEIEEFKKITMPDG